MPNMNRTSFRRIVKLDTMIRLGRLHSASQAAAEFEVSTRTIERDLQTLRDCHAEIKYNHQTHTYYYVGHPLMLPAQWLNEREIALMLIAEKALRVYAQAGFSDEIHPAFNRLLDPIRDDDDTMDQIRELAGAVCFYRQYEPTRGLRTIFQAVLNAIQEGHRLSVEYRGAGDRNPVRREIDPYVIVNNHGEWQVIANCRRSRKIKTFALDRMFRPQRSPHRYYPPAKFDPEDHYTHPFDPLDGSRRKHVVLRLKGEAMERVVQRKWHDSQTVTKSRTGKYVTFSMTCGLTPSLIRWILTLGPDAEVLSPGQLRTMVADKAEAVLQTHRGPRSK